MATTDAIAGGGAPANAGSLAVLYGVGSRLREYGTASLANVSGLHRETKRDLKIACRAAGQDWIEAPSAAEERGAALPLSL